MEGRSVRRVDVRSTSGVRCAARAPAQSISQLSVSADRSAGRVMGEGRPRVRAFAPCRAFPCPRPPLSARSLPPSPSPPQAAQPTHSLSPYAHRPSLACLPLLLLLTLCPPAPRRYPPPRHPISSPLARAFPRHPRLARPAPFLPFASTRHPSLAHRRSRPSQPANLTLHPSQPWPSTPKPWPSRSPTVRDPPFPRALGPS